MPSVAVEPKMDGTLTPADAGAFGIILPSTRGPQLKPRPIWAIGLPIDGPTPVGIARTACCISATLLESMQEN